MGLQDCYVAEGMGGEGKVDGEIELIREREDDEEEDVHSRCVHLHEQPIHLRRGGLRFRGYNSEFGV